MDVIYPYKSAPEDFEIRYSLRSLVNMPHDGVFVAGDRPIFLTGAAQHVPVSPHDDRYTSSTNNILATLRQEDVSDQFIVMHDDIFVLEPWTFRHEHRCTIDEYLARGAASGPYREMVQKTRDVLRAHGVADPLFFGLHTPTVYDKANLLDLARGFGDKLLLMRTLYHNLYPAPSTAREDVKARRWGDQQDVDVLSISDDCASNLNFRRWIADRFPTRSPYEFGESARCLVLGYSPTVWDEAAAYGDDFDAVIAAPEAAFHANAAGWKWGKVRAVGKTDLHCIELAHAMGISEKNITFCGRSAPEVRHAAG